MIDELEQLRRYLESEANPSSTDLEASRSHLRAAIDADLGTPTLGDPRAPGAVRRQSRRRPLSRPAQSALIAAMIFVAAAVGIPLAMRSSTTIHSVRPQPAPAAAPSMWRLTSSITQPAWQLQTVPGVDPYDLVCPAATTCYVGGPTTPPTASSTTGPQSVLEVSTDGGQSWAPSPLPTGFRASGFSCPAANTCMAAGDVFENGGLEVVMFTTVDSGQTWTSSPISAFGLSSAVLSCASALSCVAIEDEAGPNGSGIRDLAYVTADGGGHWAESELPGTFRAVQVQCFAGGSCIATGQSPSSYDVTTPAGFADTAAVIYSTNGGSTWRTGSLPTGSIVSSMSCTTDANCMAIENTDPGASENSSVLVTHDAGESWALTPSGPTLNDPLTLNSISCATAMDCWVSGVATPSGTANPTDTEGIISATQDGGQTWQSEQLPGIQGGTLRTVGSVSCPGVNDCLALANRPSYMSGYGEQLVLSNRNASAPTGGTS